MSGMTIGASVAQLRVARADTGDPHWDAFVHEQNASTFCHLEGWRRIVEDVLGRELVPLVAITPDGEFQGVLPLVRIRAPLLGHSLISMPYVNYGGPIGTPAAQRRLVDAAIVEAQHSGAQLLQLRCRDPIPGMPANAMRKVMVLLDMPAHPDALWRSFPAKLRSQIRRPQKEGMELRVGAEQIDPFYDVFARNMRDLGTPVYPRRFFRAVASTFDNVLFAAVYHKGVAVGAACGFVWRGEFEITWASTVRDYNPLSPNMLLYWGLMEELIRRGVRVFNFGRCTPDGSTHRFKLQWGGRTVPLPWLEWSANASAPGRPSSLLMLGSAAWRRLPLPIANVIGPPLAALLPWW
jgi:serine/alanine adding enzyme